MPLDETLKPECETFLSQFRSLLLGTLNTEEEVDLSYAPFVDHHDSFFILTSQLSSHTANLKQRGSATVFFIEDESACDEIYARRRLRFQCQALVHSRDSDAWQTLTSLFFDFCGRIERDAIHLNPAKSQDSVG
jgi:putative heme iron utilization protein